MVFLPAKSLPVNYLQDEGFDMQCFTPTKSVLTDPEVEVNFFTDQKRIVHIRWPWMMPEGRYGVGNTQIKIVQTKILDPLQVRAEGNITVVGPNDSIRSITLDAFEIDGDTVAVLKITYGTCFNDARFDEYKIACKEKRAVN